MKSKLVKTNSFIDHDHVNSTQEHKDGSHMNINRTEIKGCRKGIQQSSTSFHHKTSVEIMYRRNIYRYYKDYVRKTNYITLEKPHKYLFENQ